MNLVPGGFSVDGTSARLLTDTFGPELSFGASIAEATGTSNRIAIIKVSRGGTNLRNDWRVNSTVNTGPDGPEGFLYRALLEEVNDRLADLRADGSTANVKGFIWHQGESDRVNGVDEYVERYIQFVESVRDEFGENIPFVLGEISRDLNAIETFNANIAQLAADSANNNPDVPSGIFLVSSLGLETERSLDPNNLDTDAIHFNANGQLELGQRYALSIGNAIAPTPTQTALDRSSWSLSTNRNSADAFSAIDGNANTRWTTTQTQRDGQFFQVDLGSTTAISRVVLDTSNSPNDFPRDYEVSISTDGSNFTTIADGTLNSSTTDINFSDINARFVRIDQNGSDNRFWWSIHEINIFGGARATNLSQGQVASQSSTSFGGSASRAVDGNTNGIYRSSSTTHTNTQAQPWWQVDLGSISNISHINLYNRTDNCCRFRLSDFYVLVSDTPFTSNSLSSNLSNPNVDNFYYGPIAGDPTRIDINGSGRYVRVQLAGTTNPLSLAEVEVFGADAIIHDEDYADIPDFSHVGYLTTGERDLPNYEMPTRTCLLYTSPSPRDLSTSRMPSSA